MLRLAKCGNLTYFIVLFSQQAIHEVYHITMVVIFQLSTWIMIDTVVIALYTTMVDGGMVVVLTQI
jgi:hypothetical protein